MKKTLIYSVALLFFASACQQAQESQDITETAELSVNYEKFVLDNGLEVVFHTDKSDPVVAVALTFHVGSAREKEGRTGFAHLFEHLLFLESENLGRGGLDKMSSRIGGSGANGSTSRDRTNYFQTVPKDALEKMIWAEADKLGYFINTVTEPVLAKEKQVVKNEKRQSYDNRAYGQTSYVIGKNLYPESHPYNWQVIGSLEDLQNATLADVKEFYNQWYVPNNATLVIAGDFDSAQAKEWVEKYFAEIPGGEEIKPLTAEEVQLTENKLLYYEDNFARLPEMRYTWTGAKYYHKDDYALDILTELLTDGKTSPFYQVLVEEKKVAPQVRMYSGNSELTGEISLIVRAYPGTDLNSVKSAVEQAFARFEDEGFTEADLQRVKAGKETGFYNGLSSVLGKAFQLAQYNIFAKDPGFIEKDIQNILVVSSQDVQNIYEKYIKDRNYIATSFVPEGQKELILEGSQLAEVVEEKIVQDAEEEVNIPDEVTYERTPSSFDRTEEPPFGPAPEITTPEIWQAALNNGLDVIGIENRELPLIYFNLSLKGGLLLEDPDKVGVSNLLAKVMLKGTAEKTPEELELAIKELGANINIAANKESIEISGNTLARNYDKTINLVEEILLRPRWDSVEFELAKQQTLSNIAQQKGSPNVIASNEFYKLLYGDHILSNNVLGTENSVSSIILQDLKNYYQNNISPAVATFHVVGAATDEKIKSSLAGLEEKWKQKPVEFPAYKLPETIDSAKIYFYDVPDAKQSVFHFGYLGIPETDPDFYPATVMNYILGGGSFASRLTQELREGKGYTYGIRSSFNGSEMPGPFLISSGVRSNITLEAAALVKEILRDYPTTYTADDLANTKSFMIKSNARALETYGAKLNMLKNISDYGWSADYLTQREQVVKDMTLEEVQELAKKYADPEKMIYVVVGDASTQLDRLEELGFGKPVLLNP